MLHFSFQFSVSHIKPCGILQSKPKRLPQVLVSPRQCTDPWRHFEGDRQALVDIKSVPTAIPFDTLVTGMV